MKNSKLSIALFVLFALTSIVSKAQNLSKISDSKKQEKMELMKMAQEKLQLSDEQKIKFRAISKKYLEKTKDLKDTAEQRMAKMKQMKAIQEEKNAEMKTILSETQYKTYLELQEERKDKMKELRNKR